MTDYWMKPAFLLMIEMMQREEEGCDVSEFRAAVAEVNQSTSTSDVFALYDRISALKPLKSFPYDEPSDLAGIQKACPPQVKFPMLRLTDEQIQERLLGAWLGRSVGCILGVPVEGLSREQLEIYLKAAGAYPLQDFVPQITPPAGIELMPGRFDSVRGKINYMPRDDDTDYTILGLHLLEKFGPGFTAQNVADTWLDVLPYNLVFTAERIAYRNLTDDLFPPESASSHNPFREWIGAQIRADGFAYAAAGQPRLAAEMAFRDASVSHVKNGIYGEMFMAAMISAAFLTDDLDEMIEMALTQVPAHSRFAEMVKQVDAWTREFATWEETFDKVAATYGKYFWVHTLNNAAVVLLALIYGQGDLAQSISIAVMCGWDTDCNGATVGSIIGAWKGASGLPQGWTGQLNNLMHSAVIGFDNTKITDLALRSWKTYQAVRSFQK